jgi:hypothetical protein
MEERKMKDQAIKALMRNSAGEIIRTENQATQELNEMANWYLRGTGRTFDDIQYALKCAIEDVLEAEGAAYARQRGH